MSSLPQHENAPVSVSHLYVRSWGYSHGLLCLLFICVLWILTQVIGPTVNEIIKQNVEGGLFSPHEFLH